MTQWFLIFSFICLWFSVSTSFLCPGFQVAPTSLPCSQCRITFSDGRQESPPHMTSSQIQSQHHGSLGSGPGHRLTPRALSGLLPQLSTHLGPRWRSPRAGISFLHRCPEAYPHLGVISPPSHMDHFPSKLQTSRPSKPAQPLVCISVLLWSLERFTLVLSLDMFFDFLQ